ncbi:Osmosensitive K+ channel histidine kinase KdpD [Myxococcus hansupus]|uniref:histidine kinase n=1 Tax=Pseudomyxococcus hansupus TaxID=1297742 RepID=A0A0H4WMD7_9BACT|nr:Osmosensitive K+ channel histidine kinase KdpD [Myxococcus hansupus]
MRLRTFLTLGAVLLAVLGLGSAGGLFWMTTLLQRQTTSLIDAAERVRAAAELEITLLLLQYAHEVEVMGAPNLLGPTMDVDDLVGEVPERLAHVELYTETEAERGLVAASRASVETYLSASEGERRTRLAQAIDSTRAVMDSSIARARTARDDAQAVRRNVRLIGTLLAIFVLTGVVLFLAIAQTRIYRPLVSIRRALSAFKSGRRESRVTREGPPELQEIGAEFNDMAETVTSQDARQLQFLAGVAHDLRTPLNALKLSAQMLLRAKTLPPPEKVRDSLVRISTQVDRLERMVGDLLDRTRIEAGNLELRLEECDLRSLVEEVVELHRPSSELHRFEYTVPDTPLPWRCDSTRLSQVLTNLVSNAIKYSPKGGLVSLRLEATDREVVVSVTDEGLGIAPADIDSLFEPFMRSRSASKDIPGVGLGLSVSRRIALAHGGDIEVESRAGIGSTFRLRLPRSG